MYALITLALHPRVLSPPGLDYLDKDVTFEIMFWDSFPNHYLPLGQAMNTSRFLMRQLIKKDFKRKKITIYILTNPKTQP